MRGQPVHPEVVGGRWLASAFGLRQSSGALIGACDSGRGLPQSKTLARFIRPEATNHFGIHRWSAQLLRVVLRAVQDAEHDDGFAFDTEENLVRKSAGQNTAESR